MELSPLQAEIDALGSTSAASRFEIASNTLAFSLCINNANDDVRVVCLFEDLAKWPHSPLLSVQSSQANEQMMTSLMDLTEKQPPYNLQLFVASVRGRHDIPTWHANQI